MKRVVSAALALILVFACLACTGGNADANLGVYRAVEAEMLGVTVPVDTLFENGFSIELKAKNRCTLIIDGDKTAAKWTQKDSAITITAGGETLTGTLENGVMVLEYSEITFTFRRGDDAAPASTADVSYAATSEEFWIVSYTMNRQTYDGSYLKESGMDQTYLKLNADHTGYLMLAGDGFEITWTDDGQISINDVPYYTFSYTDADTIVLNMFDTMFYTLKK